MSITSHVIDDIIRREGDKYTDIPDDRGGPTKYGVTITSLSEYRGHPVTADDIKALTEGEARALFQALYITKPNFAPIKDDALRDLVIDCGIQYGRGRTSKWVQQIIGADPDGRFGPMSLRAIEARPPAQVYRDLLKRRFKWIGEIISADLSQGKFAEGWNVRAAEFII